MRIPAPLTSLTLAGLLLSPAAHAATPFQAADLTRAAAYSQAHRGDAVLVWQAGREVFAQAQSGFDLNAPHVLASGSKTFGGLLAVALQDAGLLRLDERAADTLTEWRGDARRDITVRQLLNFTSGLPGNVGSPIPTLNRDLSGAALAAQAVAPAGTVFTYGNAHLSAFGELVRRRTGQEPELALQARVLDALDIHPTWARDRAGHDDLAGGARLSAREWGRVGQLLLQNGQWQGRAVLSAAGLSECRQGSAALSVYGLNLWLNVPTNGTLDSGDTVPVAALNLKGDRLMPSQPVSIYMAAGAGNQRLYVLPDRDAVIVRFGRGGDWSDDAFLKLLTGAP